VIVGVVGDACVATAAAVIAGRVGVHCVSGLGGVGRDGRSGRVCFAGDRGGTGQRAASGTAGLLAQPLLRVNARRGAARCPGRCNREVQPWQAGVKIPLESAAVCQEEQLRRRAARSRVWALVPARYGCAGSTAAVTAVRP
jgi:hypothetical protein